MMKKDGNIVLIGMPGSGKSTVGVILAKTLGMDFVDADILICRRENTTLQEILDSRGLDAFLQVEEDTILEMDCRSTVIATGGSVPLREKSMEHLAKRGTFVYIDVPLPELEKRIRNITTRGIAFAPGQTLAVFIGPEGGFSDEEIELALHAGIRPVTLGKRILRTETAALFVLSAAGLLLE